MRDRTSLFYPISLTKLTRPATTASSTVFGQASPSSSAGSSSSSSSSFDPSPSPTRSSSSGLSAGEKGGIVVACLAIAAAIVVGWWKKHQVLWLVTCGRRGYKNSVKPLQAQAGHQLVNFGNGGANNVGGNPVANFGGWQETGRI